jgi:tetratricopeptide (TPR) repeat protein
VSLPATRDLEAPAATAGGRGTVQPAEVLQVAVTNGDVRECRVPVLVGHYIGDKLVNVERLLDRRSGGSLSLRHNLGAYPGPLGTCLVEDGVVVVGLGQVGELTPSTLRETTGRALLDLALNRRARNPSETHLSVASVLIGTFGGARIGIESSMESIIGAVLDANDALAMATPAPRVQISSLEFVEVYNDVATEAAHAARRIASRNAHRVSAEPRLRSANGLLLSRPNSPYANGWSRRISIRTTKDQALRYEVFTDLARSEPYVHRIQWAHADPLLRTAALPESAKDRGILFGYLLPHQIVGELDRGTALVLQLTPEAARIPWELMESLIPGARPLSVRLGMLRQLRTWRRREQPLRSTPHTALVIGNPARVAPSLPAARAEADAVAKLLGKRGFSVTLKNDAGADEIFRALRSAHYDFIHIAAHGMIDDKDPSRIGVVLENGRLLTSAEFNLPVVPTLVFLNCCHLGALQGEHGTFEPGRLAASVARSLIEMGVKVVVAAGWAVGDATAVVFAESLYSELLAGRPLMEAVRIARYRTFDACQGQDVTWGSYQVYGHDDFVLPGEQAGDDVVARAGTFVSPQELLCCLADYESRSRGLDPTQRAQLAQELAKIAEHAPEPWRNRGDVAYAFGLAYSQLEEYQQAIPWLKRAVADSGAPFKAAEQLGNAEARVARALWATDRAAAGEMFTSSASRLQKLAEIAPTLERWSLVGGTLKRWARLLEDPNERRAKLAQAMLAYQNACNTDEKAENWFYPASNRAALLLCADPKQIEREAPFLQSITSNAALCRSPDSWSRAAVADVALIKWGASTPDAPSRPETVAEAYAQAFDNGSGATPREQQSMIEHVTTIAELAQDADVRVRIDQVKQALHALVQSKPAAPHQPQA